MIVRPTLGSEYWADFEITTNDLDFLYNYLLEIETPQTPQELVRALVTERIESEKQGLLSHKVANGTIYIPKDQYEVGQTVIFPALDYKKGRVVSIRPGSNPEIPPFDVLEVAFEGEGVRQFASGLQEHVLNQPITIDQDDPNLQVEPVIEKFGEQLEAALVKSLEANEDLVRIAGRWFPRALLVDVNIGYLNLAEALLDMENGGPLPTSAILEQIELPTDVNVKLTEFSLNLALQEDGRFDEVGPAGEIQWYLRRLEPNFVKEIPVFLRYQPVEYDRSQFESLLAEMEKSIIDELETPPFPGRKVEKATVSLIFPHWRAGTLPLAGPLTAIFPTAFETPRIRFTFVDADSKKSFQGWVVRASKYVAGLREWYEENELVPGNQVTVCHGKNPGEIMITADKRRSTRDWIRTALIGVDGGVVFAMQKQPVTAAYDDRLVISVPNYQLLDQVWEQGGKGRGQFEQTVRSMMRELTKLSPQGHVNAIELYAVVNLIRRCPPVAVLNTLVNRPWSQHLGDLYFRLKEDGEGNNE